MFTFAIDGPNGAGKSSVLKAACRLLRERHKVETYRDPGGTDLAEELRTILKGRLRPDTRTQTLLYTAARRDLALERLRWAHPVVIFDRWLPSTLVYQGMQGMPEEDILDLDRKYVPLQIPARHVIILTAPVDVLIERVRQQRQADGAPDRFEQSAETVATVAHRYVDLAARYGWTLVPADGSVDAVSQIVSAHVAACLCAARTCCKMVGTEETVHGQGNRGCTG